MYKDTEMGDGVRRFCGRRAEDSVSCGSVGRTLVRNSLGEGGTVLDMLASAKSTLPLHFSEDG